MTEIFLIIIALIWIIFATFSDLKTREIPNWLNFSLIIFVLGIRFFYSLFNGQDFSFFAQGLIGFGVFFVLANLLYYIRFFAGGDAKLVMALGTVIPLGNDVFSNISLFFNFLLLFLLVRVIYDIVFIFYLGFRDSAKVKKEFYRKIMKNKKIIYLSLVMAIIVVALGFFEELLLIPGILIFILPYLYFYTKAIEEKSLVVRIDSKKLTEGDWLSKNIPVGTKVIEARWEGLSKEEISLIKKKHKFVSIKGGIPFAPGFLIIILLFAYFYFTGINFMGLWNSLW